LTHTSGLGSGGIGSRQVPNETLWPENADDTPETYVGRLAGVPLDIQPGSKWSYGGLAGIDTLARVVEVASGQPFGEFVQDRIFTPLGMNDTTILHGPDEGGDRLAAIHRPGPDKVTRIAPFLRFPKRYSSGAGGLISKAED
jgi:CubicO group peptidase (beta-lactamase class C family)